MSSLSVQAAASENPDGLALVVEDGRRWTWREVWDEVQPLLPPPRRGDPVPVRTLVATPAPETVFQMLAAIESAIPFAPLDLKLPEHGLEARREILASVMPPDALAVLFTSGSTGTPRGVVLSRSAFLASANASAHRLGWADEDRWLCVLPLSHIGGLSILTRCLVARKTVVLVSRFDPKSMAKLMEGEAVTIASFVPTMLARLLDRGALRAPPSALRAVLVGGAAAPPEVWTRAIGLGLPVLETWGMTETCSQVATAIPGGDPRSPMPLDGWMVRSREGRLEVKGAALFSGYAGQSDRSVEIDSGGWFRTGDAGQVNEDGSVSIFGRADDTIVTGGTNVAPAEVERFLESLPQVGRAVVVGIPDAEWGEIVAAALEVRPGDGTATADRDAAVDDAIRRGLATFQRPRMIVWTDRLPETAAGKLDRPALREWVTSELASGRPRP